MPPWELIDTLESYNVYQIAARNEAGMRFKIAEVTGPANIDKPEELLANAELINAAPKMFDALYQAIPHLKEALNQMCQGRDAVLEIVIEDCENAIKQAKGIE